MRVYLNFDVKDDGELVQLSNNIEVLENKNKKLEEQLAQLHRDQQKIIVAELAEKTFEVMKVTNAMKSLEQMYLNSKLKNDEVTECLNVCHGQLNSVNDLLISQQNETAALITKTMELEKQLQFAESNAEMDKYFRTVALNEKDEVMEQLQDTQRQLFYAQNTIDRNFVQIETILCELKRMRAEKQLQTIQMEKTICERDMGRREIEMENVQLKSKLKQIMSQETVRTSVAPQKRKFTDCCCNIGLVNNNIERELRSNGIDTDTDQPRIKLIIRKVKRDSRFACELLPVL